MFYLIILAGVDIKNMHFIIAHIRSMWWYAPFLRSVKLKENLNQVEQKHMYNEEQN